MYPLIESTNLKYIGLFAGSLLLFLSIHIYSTFRKSNVRRLVLLIMTICAFLHIIYIVFFQDLPFLLKQFLIGIPTVFGPLGLFYIQNLVKGSQKIELTEIINFLPFFGLIVMGMVLGIDIQENYLLQLLIVVVHWGMFQLYTIFWLFQNKDKVQGLNISEKKWLWSLLVLLTFVWLNQSILFLARESYHSFFIYLIAIGSVLITLFYFRFKSTLNLEPSDQSMIKKGAAKKAVSLNENQQLPENAHIYLNKLETLVTDEKIYLDPNLTIPKMAEKIQIQPYLLSQMINNYYHQSFPDYINSFRIEEAKTLLEDNSLKISSIAADCGFNTLSSFNLAFKKHASKTPSQYRNELIS
ncbi:helix-turn-helix transcriptional regulator [Jiulongibacter sediminis]|uniref:helix-turn-helix transcriptional regulator n=1 Tax=Jiulongibacter sediminis TaxID=1605367 RepID=UPI0026EFAE13|nr:helix-turn-helix transcriptional regulator [Jiulongibacter sediminis]